MYLQSDGGSPALREPVPLVKYYNILPYVLNILGTELLGMAYQNSSGTSSAQGFTFNRLMGDVNGTITQTPALIGKASITATIVLSAQEISDRNFIKDFVDRSESVRARKNGGGVWT
jgi:flagellar biosynthesis component FlhA